MKPLKKYEKTEYKAVPVRNTLIEMKDISELMMDLLWRPGHVLKSRLRTTSLEFLETRNHSI
jgi:hypothetical protein